MIPDISWRAVLHGAAIAVAIAAPSALISLQFDDPDKTSDDSSVLFLFFALVVLALVFGGGIAASRRPDAPLSHGILAALIAFGTVQSVGVIRRLAVGDDIRWLAIAFNAMVAATAGLLGGIFAARRERR